MGIKIKLFKFPNYFSPTGKILGRYYLGKTGKSLFKEGAPHVDPKVASLYFSADRLYNIPKVKKLLKSSNVLLDRYVGSNMAYSGGRVLDKDQRKKIYSFCTRLEFGLLKLPRPNIKILLYMPIKFIKLLKDKRKGKIDEYDRDDSYLKRVNQSYLEIAKARSYKVINCTKRGKLRNVKDINDELLEYIQSRIK